MTAAEARALFSEAYERELDPEQQRAFEAALAADPELALEYEAFVATLGLSRARGGRPSPTAREPDLLPGIQRKLRARSRGRFYADRFAERLGGGWLQPQPLSLILLALLAVAWLALGLLESVAVGP